LFSSELSIESKATEKSEPNKFQWIPGIELSNIQGISIPQHLLICISCSKEGHGLLGEYFLVEASPGYLGGSISLGASLFSGLGATGLTGKFTALRSWNSKYGIVKDNTYIGPEISVTLIIVDVELGIMRNMTKNNSSENYIFSFGLGIGL